MPRAEPAESRLEMELADEAATNDLARTLAGLAKRGDVFALWGGLGTGKTTFARAFIGAAGAAEEVPSPTFTLVQAYDAGGLTIHHFDLFRLSAPEDTDELAMDEAFADGVSLIEWPDRLGPRLPTGRLDVALAMGARPGARRARLTAHARWPARLAEAGLG